MKTVEVKTGRPYNILIEHGIIDHAGDYIRPLNHLDNERNPY